MNDPLCNNYFDTKIHNTIIWYIGTVGRLFGALVSKAGIPVPTEITQKVLTAAMHIGSGVTHVPGFDIPKVETLLWGQTVTGTVDRQAAHFFRITITQADLDNGVIISCSSTGTSESSLLDNAPNYLVGWVIQKRKLI